jgi:hypothetical protein
MLPEQLELMQETGQAVEHHQFPTPMNLKWYVGFGRQKSSPVRIRHLQSTAIPHVQSFFKTTSFWKMAKM